MSRLLQMTKITAIYIASLMIFIMSFVMPATAAVGDLGPQSWILDYDVPYYDKLVCGNSSTATTTAGSCAVLAEKRAALIEGLSDSDKDLILKTFFSETSANPDTAAGRAKAQAHIEEFFNRAAARFGTDIQGEIALIPAYYQDFCSTSASWKNCDARLSEYRSIMEEIYSIVIGGSNLIYGATDNASSSVAEGSRESIICGMGDQDTVCKKDDYGVQDKLSGGAQSGIEYFFDNNSSDAFRADVANCSGGSSASVSETSSDSSGDDSEADDSEASSDESSETSTTSTNTSTSSSSSSSSLSGCASGSTSTSSVVVDGYTFPLSGATKTNINQNAGLTKLPCGSAYGNSCHGGRGADGGAVDLGIGADNEPMGNIVVAPHDGVIMFLSNRNGYSYCHDIAFQATEGGEPIAIFGMLHQGEVSVTQGQEVKVGEQIGVVGPNECADNTVPHLHFDKSTSATTNTTGDYDNGRDPALAELINKLYENLPE